MFAAVMGYGTVGSGVVDLISKNRDLILRRSGLDDLQVKYILDLRDFPDSLYKDRLTKNFEDIAGDPEVSVVVETMGGLRPAYDFVLRCLKAGKSVVTSNKELVAEKGYELLRAAEDNGVNFMFEASVGGGIPIIRPLARCLSANEITEITGILNGTTNFILTKMIAEKMSFEDALVIAQKNGYAERDPSADIDGLDACRKICILASLCFGRHVYPEKVHTEGIRDISLADVEYAASGKYAVKLLGTARKLPDGRIYIIVRPALVPFTSMIASADGVYNEILVRGDAVGNVVFYGRGAGKWPTASAVVADIVDCVCCPGKKQGYGWDAPDDSEIAGYLDCPTALFVRGEADDLNAAATELIEAFGSNRYLSRAGAPRNELAFLTRHDTEGTLRDKLAGLRHFKVSSVIRVEDDI